MGELTKDKVEVYRLAGDVFAKIFLVFVCAGIYIAVTVFFLMYINWPLAATESILSLGIGRVILHYFPSKNETDEEGK